MVPPSASSKRPVRAIDRAGERALLVAEELALDKARRKGRAVDFDQWLVLAMAGRMDGPGDELLAGAGFARNEHRGVGWPNRANVIEHGGQRGATADDLVEVERRLDFFLEIGILLLQLFAFALGHHEIGDIDDHRCACACRRARGATRIAPRPAGRRLCGEARAGTARVLCLA